MGKAGEVFRDWDTDVLVSTGRYAVASDMDGTASPDMLALDTDARVSLGKCVVASGMDGTASLDMLALDTHAQGSLGKCAVASDTDAPALPGTVVWAAGSELRAKDS